MSDTVIGSRTLVRGRILGEDPVVVEGRVEGTIRPDAPVRIEASGRVSREVQGTEVRVLGIVEGTVTGTRRVEILAGAQMLGDVKTPRILISEGAVFRGRVEMDFQER
ncbi:MAG TPA: polymer-forming cytoskeletal protein [Myxococcota bacterium]|nr:polymer-forming cytoskeletal protein [Myxococcota bacterium]HQK51531.1 polymer-forming cytoskeletal protein [Myxococcota bacterium]